MSLYHALMLLSLGLATFGLAAFIRALPWPTKWTSRKPLGCPVCMSGWSGFAVLGGAVYTQRLLDDSLLELAFVWLLLVAIAAPLFKKLYPPDIELPLP